MSNGNKELSMSWVLVDSVGADEKLSQKIQNVEESAETHGDSDSDSISIISESGCSYNEEDEELVLPKPATNVGVLNGPNEDAGIQQDDEINKNVEEIATLTSTDLMEVEPQQLIDHLIESKFQFLINASFYVIVVVAFAMVIQHYRDSIYINNRSNDFNPTDSSQMKTDCYINIRKKLQNDAECELTTPSVYNSDNDHYQRDLKSNFKPTKNKDAIRKMNKENSNVAETVDEFKSDFAKVQFQEKIRELQMKEAYLNVKEKLLIKLEHELKKKRTQIKDTKHNKNVKKSKTKNEICKKKCKPEKQKKEKKRYRDQDSKQYNEKNSGDSTKRHNLKINPEEQFKRNFSGQWYINLHIARRDIRAKEQASDWVFDRARLRSTKRNKAHWYFQWMVDRSRHRMK